MACLLMLSACVTESVTTTPGLRFSEAAVVATQSPDTQIKAGSGFAWLQQAVKYYKDERLKDAQIQPLLEQEILRNLQAKGMQITDKVSADYFIAYTAALESALDDHAIIRQYGLLPGNARVPDGLKEVEKGSLIILVIDKNSKQTVWRSAAQVGVKFDTSMEERKQRIAHVIAEMFLTFPASSAQ